VGALAVGAVAVGRLVVNRFSLRTGRVRALAIEDLTGRATSGRPAHPRRRRLQKASHAALMTAAAFVTMPATPRTHSRRAAAARPRWWRWASVLTSRSRLLCAPAGLVSCGPMHTAVPWHLRGRGLITLGPKRRGQSRASPTSQRRGGVPCKRLIRDLAGLAALASVNRTAREPSGDGSRSSQGYTANASVRR